MTFGSNEDGQGISDSVAGDFRRTSDLKPGAPGIDRYHRSLHWSSLAQVDDGSIPAELGIPHACETELLIVLPYRGLFTYAAGRQRCFVDSNQVLFISPHQEYSVEHPLRDIGDASVMVRPSLDLLEEICGSDAVSKGAAFAEPSRPSSMGLRLLTEHVLRSSAHDDHPLQLDGWVVEAIREATKRPITCGKGNKRVVERAKELLHASIFDRVSLGQIAKEVGVSPVYLTQQFKQWEGMPLYRYFHRLRLSHALIELPHCEDITGLAFDLGFSSHSHFTSSFRDAVGLTPSEYRSSIGSPKLSLGDLINEKTKAP